MKNLKLVIALAVGMMIGSIGTVFAASTGTVQAVFAEFNLIINGKPATMDTTPLVYEGTAYLPVRNMANLFGYDVTWKADSRTIEFTTATGATYGQVPTIEVTPPASPSSTQPPVIEPSNQTVNQSNKVNARAIIEALGKKYPDQKDSIRLTQEGILSINGSRYHLLNDGAGQFDITPLIDANILQLSEIQ